MQAIADNGADILAYVMYAAILFYAPFAKTWRRAIAAVLFVSASWSLLRMFTIIAYREDTPPMFAFVVLPFFTVAYGCALRGVKILLFKIPALAALESRLRAKFRNEKSVVS